MRYNVRAVHWSEVLIGFDVGLVIAVLGEATAVGDLLIPDSGGHVLAGFVAGFVASGSARTGAFTRGLASIFGGLGILGIADVLGLVRSDEPISGPVHARLFRMDTTRSSTEEPPRTTNPITVPTATVRPYARGQQILSIMPVTADAERVL